MADWKTLYENPKHPYTKSLLSAIPIPDPKVERGRNRQELIGEIPSAAHIPSGCSFHPRCPCAMEICKTEAPPCVTDADGHCVCCHLFGKEEEK